MATGPHNTEYQIPQITLGDTFNEWRNITNDSIINKLNRMNVYTGKSGDGVSVTLATDGTMTIEHSGEVAKGVTFSGPVSFNNEYTIINAKKLTIDDYIISIGGTGASGGTAGASGGGSGASDLYITNQGGGGLEILRSEGDNANLLWRTTQAGSTVGDARDGVTGMWWVEGPHVGLTTGAWVYPLDNSFRIETNRIDGDSEGLMFTRGIGYTSGGLASGMGVTQNFGNISLMTQNTAGNSFDHIQFAHYGASDAYTDIINGAMKRRVTAPTNHGFSFGMAVRYDGTDGWKLGKATSESAAETVGLVTGIQGITVDVAYHGEIVGDFTSATTTGLTLNPGSAYFLDWETSGKLRESPPQDSGNVNKPVLVALDNISALGNAGDRGVVVNYRGSLIPDETDDLTVQLSNRMLIDQVNDFVIGDLVRFEGDEYYGWSGTAGSTGTVGEAATYSNGVWRRGQSNSEEEAEIIGMVSGVNIASDPNKFYVSINGKVSVADNDSVVPLDTGQVYFLSANSAPEGRGGMGLSADSLTKMPPQTTGHVRKPWAVAISTTEMILVNYKGNVIGAEGGCNGGGGGGGGSGLTSGITASNIVHFTNGLKDAITGVGGYANTSAISLTTANEIDVHSVLGITTGATSLILQSWREGDSNSNYSSNLGEIKTASSTSISPIHATGHETCHGGETSWDAAKAAEFTYAQADFPRHAYWTYIDLATSCSYYGDFGFTPNIPITFTVSTDDSNFEGEDSNRVDSTICQYWFKISESAGLVAGNLTKDSYLAEIPTKVWVFAASSPADSPDWVRDSFNWIATQSQSVGHLEYTSADGRVYPLSKGIPSSSVTETIVPIGTGDAGTVTLPKVSVSSDWAESTSADVRVAISGYITEATVASVEEFGGAGGSCVVDAGRNLLINGNFDYWQRLGGISAGKSADVFTSANSSWLNRGGPHKNHTTTMTPSSRFLADRWGLVMHDGHDLDGNSSHDSTTVNWNASATYGEVTRHKFLFDVEDDILPRTTSKQATNYLRLITNSAYTTASGKASPGLEQRIEGVDSVHGEKATVSFWARRSSGTAQTLGGVYVSLTQRIAGTGEYRNDSSESGASSRYCITPNKSESSNVFSLEDKWKKYTYTFDVPSIVGVSAGTIAGYAAPPADWPGVGAVAVPGEGFISLIIQPQTTAWAETQVAGGTGWVGSFDVAQVQFERGSSLTEFDDSIGLGDELKRCQRYYQHSYASDVAPASVDVHAGMQTRFDRATATNGALQGHTDLKHPMNYRPTVNLYSFQGTINKISGVSESADWYNEYGTLRVIYQTQDHTTQEAFGDFNAKEFTNPQATQFSHGDYNNYHFHWTADAEI